MKSRLLKFLSLGLALTMRLPADEPLTVRPPEQLDQLLAPIALYPDALIALILPAATVPSDIVLAARSLEGGVDPAGFEEELWDDSVKSLAHYPDVVKWMDQNLAWTKQVGEAFLAQPAEVMNAVQRLRARARAAGTLTDTPQQQVILEGDTICILPAQPDVIYIPRYDPDVVYISRSGYYPDPFLTFGIGFATGYWLGYDCDWGRRSIWTIDRRDRERYWRERHDWRRPSYRDRSDYVHNAYRHEQWRPNSNYPRPSRPSGNYSRNENTSRPSSRDWSSDRSSSGTRRNESGSSSSDRYQRSSSGGRSSPSNRRPESRPSPQVQPSNLTTADSVPTPPSPTIQAQQSPQSSSRYTRDRQDGSSRGREGRSPAATQIQPAPTAPVSTVQTQRQHAPQVSPQINRERPSGGYREREARAQVSPPSVQARSAPAQPPPSASSRAIAPDTSQSRQSYESPRSAPSPTSDRAERTDRGERAGRGDRFQR